MLIAKDLINRVDVGGLIVHHQDALSPNVKVLFKAAKKVRRIGRFLTHGFSLTSGSRAMRAHLSTVRLRVYARWVHKAHKQARTWHTLLRSKATLVALTQALHFPNYGQAQWRERALRVMRQKTNQLTS